MFKRSLCLLAMTAALHGCGMTMPRYEPSFANVNLLKAQAPMTGITRPNVTADPGADSIMVRLNPIRSPEGSLSQHVQKALEAELRLAGLLEPEAHRRLDVRLRNNEMSSPAGTGFGSITADFELRANGRPLYSASKTVTDSWDSSFIGAIAIPSAANAYNPLVRKLLAELYQDPAFISAMKQP